MHGGDVKKDIRKIVLMDVSLVREYVTYDTFNCDINVHYYFICNITVDKPVVYI